jgi:hypothetical protein
MFPGLVNCTTIDWFTEWPSDALYEVATRQMAGENLGSEEVKQAVCKVRQCYVTCISKHCCCAFFSSAAVRKAAMPLDPYRS